MNDIVEAVQRLRLAFEANGLSEPAIALGGEDDLHKLGFLFRKSGLTSAAADPSFLSRSTETRIAGVQILPPGWIYDPKSGPETTGKEG